MTSRVTHRKLGLAVLCVLLVLVTWLRLLVYRPAAGGLTFSWPAEDVILGLRMTSVAIAITVGVALATSGLLLQTLLRNALASPFILGISGGAALGVMTAKYLAEVLHVTSVVWAPEGLAALVGAVVTLLIVYVLGQKRGWIDPLSLVLVGVVVASMCGALIMFLQHLSPDGLRSDLVSWMMGAIRQGVDQRVVVAAASLVGSMTICTVFLGRAMDVATLSEDEARTVGLRLGPLRLTMFAFAGALAAIAVALAGPIGFVGLIAPHAARLVVGSRHTILVIGAACMGATLLVGGDLASQLLRVQGGRMPVGIFTALIGGPTFIWLLRRGRFRVQ